MERCEKAACLESSFKLLAESYSGALSSVSTDAMFATAVSSPVSVVVDCTGAESGMQVHIYTKMKQHDYYVNMQSKQPRLLQCMIFTSKRAGGVHPRQQSHEKRMNKCPRIKQHQTVAR